MVRQGENLVIVLPKEFQGIRNGAEVELVEAKPGVWLVFGEAAGHVRAMGAAPSARPALKVSGEELSLLRKMAAMPMESRTVKGMGLSSHEQVLLNEMKGRDLVFYSSKKYPKGVYGLSQEAYLLATADLHRAQAPVVLPAALPGKLPAASGVEKVSEMASLTWEEHLVKYGYVVIESEGVAREASAKLEAELKSGAVLGTRGFDRKYYVAVKAFYSEWGAKARKLLKEGDATVDAVSGKLGMSEVAARVEMELMREQGEIIEKKKGVYSLV